MGIRGTSSLSNGRRTFVLFDHFEGIQSGYHKWIIKRGDQRYRSHGIPLNGGSCILGHRPIHPQLCKGRCVRINLSDSRYGEIWLNVVPCSGVMMVPLHANYSIGSTVLCDKYDYSVLTIANSLGSVQYHVFEINRYGSGKNEYLVDHVLNHLIRYISL